MQELGWKENLHPFLFFTMGSCKRSLAKLVNYILSVAFDVRSALGACDLQGLKQNAASLQEEFWPLNQTTFDSAPFR